MALNWSTNSGGVRVVVTSGFPGGKGEGLGGRGPCLKGWGSCLNVELEGWRSLAGQASCLGELEGRGSYLGELEGRGSCPNVELEGWGPCLE